MDLTRPYRPKHKYNAYIKELKAAKTHNDLYKIITKAYSDRGLSHIDIDFLDEYAAQMGMHLILR